MVGDIVDTVVEATVGRKVELSIVGDHDVEVFEGFHVGERDGSLELFEAP